MFSRSAWIALVPFGGGFVQKDQPLVDEAELDVAQHARVFAQPLGLDQFGGFFVGEVHLAGFLDQRVELLALQRHLAEGDKGSAHVLGHLHKVFPCVGIAAALPEDGGNVLGDVAGQALQAVALNKGHHVVFQREQVIGSHRQTPILADGGGVGMQETLWRRPERLAANRLEFRGRSCRVRASAMGHVRGGAGSVSLEIYRGGIPLARI